jgi:hypothetical protein
MFEENISQTQDEIVITISIKKRKYAIEQKLIYTGDPLSLVPQELRDKVVLVSKPLKKVSNMNKSKYINSGEWIYKIIKEQKKPVRKRQPRKPRATKQNTLTSSADSGTIKETSV